MTMVREIVLKNGRIIDPDNNLDVVGDILIREGVIASSGPAAAGDRGRPAGGEAVRVVDCSGKWLVPGLIDMHVHLREPGEEYKETIATGTRAAAAGGFTAVACMPNTSPVNDNQSVTRFILAQAAAASARVYPVGAVSLGSRGEGLAEYGEMKNAGCVALSDDGRPVTDSQLMRRALEYAGDYDLLVISHSEEASLSRHGVMHEGALSTRLGLRGIPGAAEAIAVYRDLALAAHTGRPVHIAHVSTAESVELIRRAKNNGWPVSAETAPHYFALTEQAVADYDANAKMNPPLRSEADRQAIRQGLADGTIDAVATDHAPHSSLEKNVEFALAANGIIGLETALPLTLQLVREGLLDASRLVRLLSVNPARLLKVAGGTLSPRMKADITVIDPEEEYLYTADRVVSRSRNSPFLGHSLRGRAVLTIMDGVITHEAGV